MLQNLAREAVEHFRRTVALVDRIGEVAPSNIFETTARCAADNAGPAVPYRLEQMVQPRRGHIPARLVQDPAGYFVLYVDRARSLLALEHYRKGGMLDAVLEGTSAAELYTPVIEQGLLSRLDHAAYLGRELARAERSLAAGEPYVQDAAPERTRTTDRGCGSTCTGAGGIVKRVYLFAGMLLVLSFAILASRLRPQAKQPADGAAVTADTAMPFVGSRHSCTMRPGPRLAVLQGEPRFRRLMEQAAAGHRDAVQAYEPAGGEKLLGALARG